jgi:hypothetical protein
MGLSGNTPDVAVPIVETTLPVAIPPRVGSQTVGRSAATVAGMS